MTDTWSEFFWEQKEKKTKDIEKKNTFQKFLDFSWWNKVCCLFLFFFCRSSKWNAFLVTSDNLTKVTVALKQPHQRRQCVFDFFHYALVKRLIFFFSLCVSTIRRKRVDYETLLWPNEKIIPFFVYIPHFASQYFSTYQRVLVRSICRTDKSGIVSNVLLNILFF